MKVTKEDLVNGIKNLTVHIVEQMLKEQELQGNPRNIKIFQEGLMTDSPNGGFTWNQTTNGHSFWSNVTSGNFKLFYKEFPETEISNPFRDCINLNHGLTLVKNIIIWKL